MSDDTKAFWFGLGVGTAITTVIFMLNVPPPSVSRDLRAKAVELNAAEWKVDPKTGKTEFTWKEQKP